MGFITGNTNSFDIYLTDKGREVFVKKNNRLGVSGLKDVITHFSLLDDDANYDLFYWTGSTFNSKKINKQDIRTINNSTITTNGLSEVFTQTALRGSMVDNNLYTDGLFTTQENTAKNYIIYQPDIDLSSNLSILNYRTLNGNRQFKLINNDGVYLKAPLTSYETGAIPNPAAISDLVEDYDYFPINGLDVNKFKFINSKFTNTSYTGFTGSNSINKINSDLQYSKITKPDILVNNERYFIEFPFYFRYINGGFDTSANLADTTQPGNLVIKLYALFGTNKIQLTIDPSTITGLPPGNTLQQYNPTTKTWVNSSDVAFIWILPTNLVQVTGSTETDNAIVMYYAKNTEITSGSYHYDTYNLAPNGFNFRVKVSTDITKFYSATNNIALNNKDLSIIVEYSKLSQQKQVVIQPVSLPEEHIDNTRSFT